MKIIVVDETDYDIFLTTPSSVTQCWALWKTLLFCRVYKILL